ncbi:hypothetical protein ACKWRH_05975 [Bradyrhizobium sp. Pa8]|uniref:hypothetical protein n=1 Tax=Bradyrhizobium sp. Pa8 TaxID=3386552 RepID=UPI00403F1D4A
MDRNAARSELASFVKDGIGRDIAAVRQPSPNPTVPVEEQINRLKTLKRQMYGRSG